MSATLEMMKRWKLIQSCISHLNRQWDILHMMNWLKSHQRQLELERNIWPSLQGRLQRSRDWFRSFITPSALWASPSNRGGRIRIFPLCEEGIGSLKNKHPMLKAQPLSLHSINSSKIPTMLENSIKLSLRDGQKRENERRKRNVQRLLRSRIYCSRKYHYPFSKRKKLTSFGGQFFVSWFYNSF